MSDIKVIPGKSYSPYSGIEETCFVEGKSGILYPGVRFENISFPLTISAVQAAVCSCLANEDEPKIIYQAEPRSELITHWIEEFNLHLEKQLPNNGTYYNPLHESPDDITDELHQLCKKAVTIHSDFPVAAILITDAGCIHGVNVEVAAWSLGLCAERIALSRAISAGITTFNTMHISAPKSEFCSPCGACRQVLNEVMPKAMIHLHHNDNNLSMHYVEHLLPHGFTSGSLKNR